MGQAIRTIIIPTTAYMIIVLALEDSAGSSDDMYFMPARMITRAVIPAVVRVTRVIMEQKVLFTCSVIIFPESSVVVV